LSLAVASSRASGGDGAATVSFHSIRRNRRRLRSGHAERGKDERVGEGILSLRIVEPGITSMTGAKIRP
jgi:hypothetical protein